MISTKWFQGIENLNDALNIRKEVFISELNQNENNVSDIYDEFSFNVVVYNDNFPIGTGRLLFKDSKYLLDNICVLKEYRGNHYSDLIIRMLIRKAVNLGAEKTFAFMDKKYKKIFMKIGFEVISDDDNNNLWMVKNGDVGGHCCN